jgi:hypothetical protein
MAAPHGLLKDEVIRLLSRLCQNPRTSSHSRRRVEPFSRMTGATYDVTGGDREDSNLHIPERERTPEAGYGVAATLVDEPSPG